MSKYHLRRYALILTAASFVVVGTASAGARTNPFTIGATIDPGAEFTQPCGPTDANCFVAILGVQDEGSTLTSNAVLLNFVGSGVSATSNASGTVTITIPGGSSTTTQSITFSTSTGNIISSTINGVSTTTTISELRDLLLSGTTTVSGPLVANSATSLFSSIVSTLVNSVTGIFTNLFASVANFGAVVTGNITATGTAQFATTSATNFSADTITTSSVNTGSLSATGTTSLATTSVSNLTATSLSVPNSINITGNIITSNIGGSVATSSVIGSNTLTFSTSTGVLTSSINGLAATTTIQGISGVNTGDVSLTGVGSYLSLVGQALTKSLINLASDVTGILGISNGGTGASTAAGARANLGAAASGVNSDITSLTGLTAISLPTNSVGSSQITDSAVTGADIAAGTISNTNLANSSFSAVLGTSGTDISISGSPVSLGGTLTLNIPSASSLARGLLTTTDWATFNSKVATTRSITTGAGSGLSGGGDLSADRSLSLDINGLTQKTSVSMADAIAIYDPVTSTVKKITRSDFLQGLTGALTYQGTYNASTHTPTISDASGTAGQVYAVSVAGSHNFGSGTLNLGAGDFLIHNGTVWQLAPSSNTINTIFGRTGNVVATTGDYTANQITSSSTINISATTVQGAINELDLKKLTSSLANGSIFIGNGSAVATAQVLSGDATLSNTGTLTISNNAINSAKIADNSIVDADINSSAAITLSKLASGSNIITSITVPTGSNANGGSIASNVLTLSLADATNPGLVSTAAQTFAGAKTFSFAPIFSSLATGSIPFIGAGGTLSQNNSNFFWDSANTRLGVGTNNPLTPIHVSRTNGAYITSEATGVGSPNFAGFVTKRADFANGSAGLSLATGASTDWTLQTKANQNYLTFTNNTGLDVLTLLQNKNVGIGTLAPGNALHIASSTGAISGLRLGINSGTATTTANGKTLTVNSNGDVVLVDVPNINGILPSQSGNGGKYLETDGNTSTWQQFNEIQTANSSGTTVINKWGTTVLIPTLTSNITLQYPDAVGAWSKKITVVRVGTPNAFTISHVSNLNIVTKNNFSELNSINGAVTLEVTDFIAVDSGTIRQVSGTGIGSTALAFNVLTNAIASGALDNTNFTQTWNWSTATSTNALALSANTLTSGSLLSLSSASASSTGNLVSIALTNASSSATALNVSTLGSGLAAKFKGAIAMLFGADYTPASATVNDAVFANASRVRIAPNAGFTGITGIANGSDGKELTLVNSSSTASFILYNQSTSSTAANRIITGTGADLVVGADASIKLVYDATSLRWRVVGGSGSGSTYSSGDITDKPTGGVIGTAATTVDVATNFNVNQTTTGQTLSLPNPTNTTATKGKVVTINNVGTANFTMGTVTVPAGSYGSAFVWTGTVWNPINAASNVGAEYGQVTAITTGQTTTSTSFVDVTGSSFTLPSAGTYQVTYSLSTWNAGANGAANYYQITDSSGTVVPNSYGEVQQAGTTNNSTLHISHTVQIITTGQATYKIQWKVSAGTGTISNTTGVDGNSTVTWNKISGNTPITGQTLDYTQAYLSSQSNVNNNTVIAFNASTGSIPYSGGNFTLTAGKTYELTAGVNNISNLTRPVFSWYDSTNGVYIGSQSGLYSPTDGASNAGGGGISRAIITPSSNIVVQFRVSGSTGGTNGTISGGDFSSGNNYGAFATVTQLGSTSVSTGVAFSTLSAAIASGALDNTNYSQAWNWSTLTTGAGLTLNANALTTGSALSINSSNTGTTGNLFAINSSSTGAVVNGLARLNFTGAHTGNGFQIDDATLTGNAMAINANALTTGTGLSLTSSYAAGNSTNGLLYVANTGAITNGTIFRVQSNSTAGSGLTVLANGNIGVGTSTPSAGLDIVRSLSGNTAFRAYNSGGTTTSLAAIFQGSDSSGSSGSKLVSFRSGNATEWGSVTFTASGVAYNTTSDERLKQNIVDTSIGLDDLMKIRIKDYEYKKNPGIKVQGVIAQELYGVYGQAVTIGSDEVDSNGNLTNPWQVDYSKLTPLLVRSIQDQQKLLGEYKLATSTQQSTFITDIQTETPYDPIAIITEKLNSSKDFLKNLVTARVTAIRGYFDEIFTKKVHTEQICVKKSDGTEICVNGDQLQNMVDGKSGSQTGGGQTGAGASGGSTTPDSTTSSGEISSDTGTLAGDTSPQATESEPTPEAPAAEPSSAPTE